MIWHDCEIASTAKMVACCWILIAVGLSAARRARADGTIASDIPIVSLACAHPAKFEKAVTVATGNAPALPHIDLMNRPEQMQTIAADVDAVKALVLAQSEAHDDKC